MFVYFVSYAGFIWVVCFFHSVLYLYSFVFQLLKAQIESTLNPFFMDIILVVLLSYFFLFFFCAFSHSVL